MQRSKEFLVKVYNKAKERGKLNKEVIEYLESKFPGKTDKIIEIVNREITKYCYNPSKRIIWTVIGENDEYLIYPKRYCSCQDFYKRVVIKRKKEYCKHIIAQIIGEAIGKFKIVEWEDDKFRESLKEVNLKI